MQEGPAEPHHRGDGGAGPEVMARTRRKPLRAN